MELNDKQLYIAHTKKSKVLVVAAAGSGKTATITERINYLLDIRTDPSSIVAITFTNNAAEEMRERLGAKALGVFIGTIHGYCNYLLYSSGIATSDLIENEDFDELFERIKQYPQCVKTVDYLVLDEGQDTTKEQFEFLLETVKPNNYMIVFDHRQTIFRWNGAVPEFLLKLEKQEDVTTFRLNENYRCGEKIINYAKGIMRITGNSDYFDDSRCASNIKGCVVTFDYNIKKIIAGFQYETDYKNWFVLTRSNEQLDTLAKEFDKANIPYCSFKRADMTKAELTQKLNSDAIKLLTIHASKGLQAKYVMVIGAQYYDLEEKCVSYVAATRAIERLIWVSIPRKKKKEQYDSWET